MKKCVITIFISLLIILAPMPISAANNQANTIRCTEKEVTLSYYRNQGSFETNEVMESYTPLTRYEILHMAEYLAFDNDGYLIPWDKISIDQNQLTTINNAISKGREFFNEEGITTPGGHVNFPLTLTTPDGRSNVITISLNIGGDGAVMEGAYSILNATNVVYDITKGPLTWDALKGKNMANIYYVGQPNESQHYFNYEAVEQELQDINDAIIAGKTGTFTVHGILTIHPDDIAFVTVEFTVTLFSSLCSVSFEPNNGETMNPYTNVPINTTIVEPAKPVRSGYEFAGWYVDANFQTAWDFTTDVVTSNITLYAKWIKIEEPTKEVPKKPADPTDKTKPEEIVKVKQPVAAKGAVTKTGDYNTMGLLVNSLFISSIGVAILFSLTYKKVKKIIN